MSGYRELHSLTGFHDMSGFDTKFADMPAPVRGRWCAWARSHDWGQGAFFSPACELAGCMDYSSDGSASAAPHFSTPREMRDWAGY